ncbi:MAG TPA: hemolysin family protein [Syntrophales bacterium]|nr:hemolysin family protein [Syntrophales bacterium]
MEEMYLEGAIILVLIFVNGFFAMSEIALLSAKKTKLALRMEEGDRRAAQALRLAEEPGRFLSTIQIGITLVGILAGAYGGATIGRSLGEVMAAIPPLAPYHEALSLGVVVVVITVLSIVLGELVPKQIALRHAEAIASNVAVPISRLSIAAYPLVRFLTMASEAILRLPGLGGKTPPPVTEEEVKIMMREGRKAGIFHDIEHDLVQRVFSIDNLGVTDIMTPRPDVIWLDPDDDGEENLRKIRENAFSYFPVARGSLDGLIGVVDVKDLLNNRLCDASLDLEGLARKPVIIPESLTASKVLEHFKKSPIHMAFVVDEYGIIQGLVTVTDILEALVGDLPSLSAPSDPGIFRRSDGSWLIDGMIPLEKVKETLHLSLLPQEEEGNYHTLGGMIMTALERIPAVGDRLEWDRYRFEVVDMDGNRVDKVLVTVLEGGSQEKGG